MKSLNTKLWLGLIVSLAVAIRSIILFKYGDFWGDEMFSFVYSQKPWVDSFKFWLWETNPPLHMLILKLWFYIFPTNELWARIPSLLFGIVSIPILYIFIKRIFNVKTGLIAALLLALSPYHIFISATARGYALLILLSIISLNYFFKIFVEKQTTNKKDLSILALTNFLILFTHLTAAALIAGQLLVLIGLRQPGSFKKWLKINIIPFIIAVSWLATSAIFKLNLKTLDSAWFWQIKEGPLALLGSLRLLTVGPTWTSFVALVLFIVFILYTDRKKIITKNFWILFVFVFLPISGATLLGVWNIKFFLIALPTTIILLAILGSFNKLYWIIIAALMLPGIFGLYRSLPINQWNNVNLYLKHLSNPVKKQVFLFNNFATKLEIDRYVSAPLLKIPYYPANDWINWDYILIAQNYLRYIHPQNEINTWIENNIPNDIEEIIVYQEKNFGADLVKTLQQKNWKEQDVVPFRILSEPTIFYFTRE